MDHPLEIAIVSTLVLLASAFLVRRYLRAIKSEGGESHCGKASCGCSVAKPISAKK